MIAACRGLELPARYVSGYVFLAVGRDYADGAPTRGA
jgi:transglutaminase-like putative cysteine protease